MLKLDKHTLAHFREAGSRKIKVFFYDAGCSGTKLDIMSDFQITLELILIETNADFEVYVEGKDKEKFENCSVTMLIPKKNNENPHLAGNKIKYIYTSDRVVERCGCGTSFGFTKKIPTFHLENLKNIGKIFKS